MGPSRCICLKEQSHTLPCEGKLPSLKLHQGLSLLYMMFCNVSKTNPACRGDEQLFQLQSMPSLGFQPSVGICQFLVLALHHRLKSGLFVMLAGFQDHQPGPLLLLSPPMLRGCVLWWPASR